MYFARNPNSIFKIYIYGMLRSYDRRWYVKKYRFNIVMYTSYIVSVGRYFKIVYKTSCIVIMLIELYIYIYKSIF